MIIIFLSISDSLFNNISKAKGHSQGNQVGVTKEEFDRFLIELTVKYEFDYVEFFHSLEVIEYLKIVHTSILEKPHKRENSKYSIKGPKPGQKCALSGFKD